MDFVHLSRVSSNTGDKWTKSIAISIRTKTIGKICWLSLGISTTLAITAIAGGLRVRGGDSWPVRVGVQECRSSIDKGRVSLGRDGGGHGQTRGNQKFRHVCEND